VNIVNGVGSLSISDQKPETVTLTLLDSQSTGLDVSSTQNVVFASGAATRYVILDPSDGTVGTPILVVVQAHDQFGNVATGESRDVRLDVSGSATGSGTVNIASGVGTRSISNQVPEIVTLSLTDINATGLNVSSAQNVEFFVDVVTQFVILNPTDGTVDAAITVTVQAQDQFGNLVATENRDVTLVTSGSATGGGVVNIVNGVGSRDISDQQPETVTLTLLDSQNTGLDVTSTQAVTFSLGAASAANSTITANPTSIVADGLTTSTITVQLIDGSGNNLTAGGDVVVLNTNLGSIPATPSDNGNGTYTATLTSSTTVGPATIAGTVNGSGMADIATVAFTVVVPSPANSTITANPTSIVADGVTASTITVQLIDGNGNNLTVGGDAVVLSTTVGSISAAGDNGDGTYTATLTSTTAAMATITGTVNGSGMADNATVDFTAGVATSLLVTGISDPFTSGATSDVTVTVIDQFLNTVTDYTGTISFSSSDLDVSVVLPADYTFLLTDAGTVTIAGGITLITLGEHSVTATDGTISGTQTGITVQ